MRARRIVLLVVAIAGLLALVSLASDLRTLGDRLASFAWSAWFAAAGLAVANYVIRWARWQLYLRRRAINVPAGSSAQIFVAGFALAVTPGKVGELVKSFLLRSLHDVPITASAPVVVAERVSDLVALLVLAVAGVAIYGVAVNVVVASAVVVGAGLVVLAWPRLAHAVIRLVTRPRRLSGLYTRLLHIYDGLADLTRPTVLLWSTAIGAVAWLCECVGFWLVLRGFPGTDVPLGLATLIYAATTIAGALSFLPGGLGVTEGAMTLLLVQAHRGVDNDTAIAAAILTRLATLWLSVGFGVIAMAIVRRRGGRTDAPAQNS
jgi:uncharacterized protein (TIRG00374 family)